MLILTPHFNHSELVIKALNKGKAIYVEKPLALTEESLIEIEEAIYNSENPKLFVGFNRDLQTLHNLLNRNSILKLQTV